LTSKEKLKKLAYYRMAEIALPFEELKMFVQSGMKII